MEVQFIPPPITPPLDTVPASATAIPTSTSASTSASTPPSTSQPQPSSQHQPSNQTTQTQTLPLPKIFTYPSSSPPVLIAQGAEALLYKSTFLLPTLPCALKYRPSKPYRHPILDTRLTKHRILSEARVLVRCRKEGVTVPGVYALDEREGWVVMEWVDGVVVRVVVNEFLVVKGEANADAGVVVDVDADVDVDANGELKDLMERIGRVVGKMHAAGIVHGDLTTSNLILRPLPHDPGTTNGDAKGSLLEGEIVLIDFGLASMMAQDEDRAVDLYVLERAFGSTHPRAEALFKAVLDAYGRSWKGGAAVLKKLEDVRMRGRKRSMLG